MSHRPVTVEEIDAALTECSVRLRKARETVNYEAYVVYGAQANRLLTWRKELTDQMQPA